MINGKEHPFRNPMQERMLCMDKLQFHRFGTMIDCSRGAVMTVDTVKRWIDTTADLGYNTLMLYTEDTFEIEGHPYFGYMRGRYSHEELKAIDDYAAEKGMELIPCIQTLAHLEAIFRWRTTYRDIRDCEDILLVGEEKTYKLIDAMFATVHKCFRSRTVNIGMDEAHMLGRGQYFDIHGSQDRFEILLDHLNRVAQIAGKYGFELLMWGDMFFRLLTPSVLGGYYDREITVPEKIRSLIPDNVNLIYWDYYSRDPNRYSKNIRSHASVKENIWFAGGLWCWSGFAPSNQFSMDAATASFSACAENGVRDIILTMWGDDGAECSKFAMLPSLYYASRIARGEKDLKEIKEGFARKYGIGFDDFMLLDLPGTPKENQEIVNPERYMLYNDCFMGLLDSTIEREGIAESYIPCAEKLNALAQNPDFGYLFATLGSLCDVLSVKYELGSRTRSAYVSGDMDQLKVITEQYDVLLGLLDVFYTRFRDQWFRENKPNGFELHDIRLGGLIQRVKHCRDRLNEYLSGELKTLSELDEPLLDHSGNGTEFERRTKNYQSWTLSALVDVL